MPHSTEKFEPQSTLPDPELNPLLNPLLAAHMGRWAEVYFTSPPEKRAEAVSELLRELEKEPPSQSASDSVTKDASRGKEITARAAPQPPQGAVERFYTCNSCGHDNPLGQKFCGMCGATLESSPELNRSQIEGTAPISQLGRSEPETYKSVEYPTEPALGSTTDGSHDVQGAPWPVKEKYLPRFAGEAEPVPYRYRLYIGIAVAILLAGLVYLGWRGTGTSSNDATQSAASRTIPSAPPEQANPAPANPAPQPRAEEASSTEQKTPTFPAQSQARDQAQSEQSQQRPAAEAPTAPQPAAVAAGSSAVGAGQNGSEELALAEAYLNGSGRTPRNSGEAAPWLWRAVAKGNVSATITLSDLYLRGDGVPKNCDQARLLLDAAARKGGAAAAERLRNLEAFGCR